MADVGGLLGLGSEATAAILGAIVGGGIALVGQGIFSGFGALRARRVAAQVIYAELLGNLATVVPAVTGHGWSSTKPAALRAAWETYGARLLLPWHRAHDVGAVAAAYNRVDDIAWLAVNSGISPKQDYTAHVDEIFLGLYVVGRVAAYSDSELAARQIPVEKVRALLSERRGVARAARRESRRARLVSLGRPLVRLGRALKSRARSAVARARRG